jgi:hypothetical protein
MSIEKVLKKLKSSGVVKASELSVFTNRVQLRRYVDDGLIQSIGYGFYADPSLDPFEACLLVVAKYYPKAVVSNRTALSVYKLTDERIDQIDVDIPNTTSIRNSLLRVHRISKGLMVGVVRLDIRGHTIRIYSRERALCDIYNADPDGPIFYKAIKRYVKAGEVDSVTIAKFDRKFKTSVLKALSQELADG